MNVTVVKFNPDGDGVTALYLHGKLFKYGDYYHDKIDEWIEGFISGLEYISKENQYNISLLINKENFNSIDEDLDEEIMMGEPPKKDLIEIINRLEKDE